MTEDLRATHRLLGPFCGQYRQPTLTKLGQQIRAVNAPPAQSHQQSSSLWVQEEREQGLEVSLLRLKVNAC